MNPIELIPNRRVLVLEINKDLSEFTYSEIVNGEDPSLDISEWLDVEGFTYVWIELPKGEIK